MKASLLLLILLVGCSSAPTQKCYSKCDPATITMPNGDVLSGSWCAWYRIHSENKKMFLSKEECDAD